MAKKKEKLHIKRKTKRMIAIVIAAIIIAGVLYGVFMKPEYEVSPAPFTKKYNAVYQYIHDGDTAVFYIDTGEKVICRFLAVDTPEIGEEGYDEAKHFCDVTLEKASKIVLEMDPVSEEYDKYERLLAWVWVDGELLQAKLIREGHAKVAYIFSGEYLYLDYLRSVEKSVTQNEASAS